MASKSLWFILACLLLITCASIIPKLTQQDVEKGKALYHDLTLEQLTRGRKVYVDHCGSCHQLYSPTTVPEETWKKKLGPMAKMSKLDSAATEEMTRYIRVSRLPAAGNSQN